MSKPAQERGDRGTVITYTGNPLAAIHLSAYSTALVSKAWTVCLKTMQKTIVLSSWWVHQDHCFVARHLSTNLPPDLITLVTEYFYDGRSLLSSELCSDCFHNFLCGRI